MESSPKTHAQQTTYIDGDDDQDAKHCSYAAQLVTTSALPMVLHAAVQLQVFEIIAKAGPGVQLSPSEIASQLHTKNPAAAAMLDRMFRLLASVSVLTCSVVDIDGTGKNAERLYGLAPVGKYFVRDEDGGSMGPSLALLQDKVFIDSWYQLKDSILEGGVPFDRVHGSNAFEYPAKDPRFNEVFNQAMISHSAVAVKRILECYKGFEHLKTLVDVGGGLGMALNKITSKYPTIKGINFDLPHVIKHAPAYPGVEHVGGDMFESVPKADAIYMKLILHDWSDDHCIKLLKNCYKALPADGKVIVVEIILPVKPDSSAFAISSSQLDLLMMTQNPGGKERSEHEFLALAKEAGFRGITLECFVFNLWVMEFYK